MNHAHQRTIREICIHPEAIGMVSMGLEWRLILTLETIQHCGSGREIDLEIGKSWMETHWRQCEVEFDMII